MNPRIKKLWIDALLSGEYKQGKSQLRTKDDKYCCLGVLCNLYLKEKDREWEEKVSFPEICDFAVDGDENYLPPKVMEWAELDSKEGWDNCLGWGEDSRDSLAMQNDQGKSFEEIALAIEEKL